ncbi:type I asparaginase [Aromatoleum sp.]|uniref:type I asparaginase n=1 Tax=Aromatoleum sp. TaxID=2307007 RepID=UPI002FC7597B
MASRVLILYAGGTIGMARADDGYRPMTGFEDVLRRLLREQVAAVLPDFDVVALPEPIDSANLQPSHWTGLARELVVRWQSYDGFVVLHGTDTMAYSASALSFMLRGADKPVIFTGAQIPLGEPDSDALGNLLGALTLAGRHGIPEICLYFSGRLLRGNRSTKLKSEAFDAFESPNYPHLADVGADIALYADALLAPATRAFVVPQFDAEAVAVLPVYPGISARIVDAITGSPRVRGLVLRTYGVGNAPDAQQAFMDSLARATGRGLVVLNTTQCVSGHVIQGTYATGAALDRIGVLPGGDMTLEAAFAKLHFVLATNSDADVVRRALGESLCGEVS